MIKIIIDELPHEGVHDFDRFYFAVILIEFVTVVSNPLIYTVLKRDFISRSKQLISAHHICCVYCLGVFLTLRHPWFFIIKMWVSFQCVSLALMEGKSHLQKGNFIQCSQTVATTRMQITPS